MVKLIEGNVLLKPTQRRQFMGWLKRVQRLGERLGNFVLTITLQRSGRHFEVNARVHDAAGDFDCPCVATTGARPCANSSTRWSPASTTSACSERSRI